MRMRRLIGILAVMSVLLGIAILLYNPLQNHLTQDDMNREIEAFEQAIDCNQSDVTQEEQKIEKAYQSLREEMELYNTELFENKQAGLVDAWSYEQAAFDFSEYGLPTEVVGILYIPAMNERLPVYLGATRENLARGVAVLGQTSMPVGGMNTNCVIAGHRGYKGVPFFRDIEKLKPGDQIYLTTHWETKVYEVESMAIIQPDSTEAVLIQKGRELLTLITCHPYNTATHRYVVYCTLAEDEITDLEQSESNSEADHSAEDQQMEKSFSQQLIQLEQWLPILAVPLVTIIVLVLVWPKKKGTRRNEKE